ncbi:hypothetical protein CWI36_2496p0010 [Hamiltosporidium magnivora]|uniref:Uncharacterized protein n=1 Tax=Hamiltosporidium magnivora TaxID=148818 RepID=A0A4Q9KTR4_9MICR|nr:hypothetical protein CWI36_2496p0010 [Hamiltosporidium magnivora]
MESVGTIKKIKEKKKTNNKWNEIRTSYACVPDNEYNLNSFYTPQFDEDSLHELTSDEIEMIKRWKDDPLPIVDKNGSLYLTYTNTSVNDEIISENNHSKPILPLSAFNTHLSQNEKNNNKELILSKKCEISSVDNSKSDREPVISIVNQKGKIIGIKNTVYNLLILTLLTLMIFSWYQNIQSVHNYVYTAFKYDSYSRFAHLSIFVQKIIYYIQYIINNLKKYALYQ